MSYYPKHETIAKVSDRLQIASCYGPHGLCGYVVQEIVGQHNGQSLIIEWPELYSEIAPAVAAAKKAS